MHRRQQARLRPIRINTAFVVDTVYIKPPRQHLLNIPPLCSLKDRRSLTRHPSRLTHNLSFVVMGKLHYITLQDPSDVDCATNRHGAVGRAPPGLGGVARERRQVGLARGVQLPLQRGLHGQAAPVLPALPQQPCGAGRPAVNTSSSRAY